MKNIYWAMCGFLTLVGVEAFSCELKMGYRTNARVPNIAKAPDNSGLYLDLYQEAAKRIGCKLTVVRAPKKRVLKDLKVGKVDFYPGFNFSKKRAQFAFYSDNGLPGGDIGISHKDYPEVSDITKGIGDGKILHFSGAAEPYPKNARKRVVKDMELGKALDMLKDKKADFFFYNNMTMKYYLKGRSDKNEFKVHPNCCGGRLPLYVGFSRNSHHFKSEPNAKFDQSKEWSVENFPVAPGKESIAEKFFASLESMAKDGTTGDLFKKYYGNLGSSH